MTDQELLQAIGQVVEAKMEPLRQDIRTLTEEVAVLKSDVQTLKSDVQTLKSDVATLKVEVQELQQGQERLETRVDQVEAKVDGVRVYMDTELRRTMNLLLEGQKALWDRFVPQEEFEPLEDRTQVLELTVKRHSQEIRALQYA